MCSCFVKIILRRIIIFQTIVSIICIGKQAQSAQYESYGPDTNALINLVSYTDKIKTLSQLGESYCENSNQQPFTGSKLNNDEESIKADLYKKMQNKMRNLNCTYAHFAKLHLDHLHAIIDYNLFREETFEMVKKLKSSYLSTAEKTILTLINMNYKPYDWMWNLIGYLQKNEKIENFHKSLFDIINTLTDVLSTVECNKEIVLSKLSGNSSSIVLKHVTGAVDWTELQKEIECFKEIYFWSFTNTSDKTSESNLFTKISTIYLSEKLRQITRDIQYNIKFGIDLVLQQNKSILSYAENEKYRFLLMKNVKHYKRSYNKRTKSPTITIDDGYDGFDDNDYEENIIKTYTSDEQAIIQYVKYRLIMVSSMLHSKQWHPISKLKFDKLYKQTDQDPLNYYKNINGIINLISDEIMDDLQCLYVYYANNHLTETQKIVNHMNISSDERKKNLNLNIELVFRYLDVSLMTLATIINADYQPPGWMVLIVLYLEKVPYLSKNLELLGTETTKILKIIKTASDLCNPNSEKPPILDVPLENIEVGIKYQNMKVYARWQREIVGIKIVDPTRSEYVSAMYSNLIQIVYLLNLNSLSLKYSKPSNPTDFLKLHPSKWLLFTGIELKEDVVDTLRWDSMEHERNNSSWEKVRNSLLDNIKSKNFEHETDGITRINNSVFVYSAILNFLAVAVIRLVVAFIIDCNIVGESRFITETDKKNNYVKHCTSLSKPIEELIDISGLKNRDFFYVLLIIELKNYESWVSKSTGASEESFERFITLCILKLNEVSMNMNVKAYYPIDSLSITDDTPENIIWNRLETRTETANKYLSNFKEHFAPMYKDVRTIYRRNLLIDSADLLWPRVNFDKTISTSPESLESRVSYYYSRAKIILIKP